MKIYYKHYFHRKLFIFQNKQSLKTIYLEIFHIIVSRGFGNYDMVNGNKICIMCFFKQLKTTIKNLIFTVSKKKKKCLIFLNVAYSYS